MIPICNVSVECWGKAFAHNHHRTKEHLLYCQELVKGIFIIIKIWLWWVGAVETFAITAQVWTMNAMFPATTSCCSTPWSTFTHTNLQDQLASQFWLVVIYRLKVSILTPQVLAGFCLSIPEFGSKLEGFGMSANEKHEWVLMRSMKTPRGLTHGKGMDEIQRLVWTLSLPSCAEVQFSMQELAGIHYGTSDQHQETSSARKERDERDTWKLIAFLQIYDPFTEGPFRPFIAFQVE